jgi:hypothetical protein
MCSARRPTRIPPRTRPRPITTTSCRGPRRGRADRSRPPSAYQQEVVARAGGDAQRFLSVLNAYQRLQGRDGGTALSRNHGRQVLKKANKVLIDKSSSGVVPYLPLARPGRHPTSAAAAGAARPPTSVSSGRPADEPLLVGGIVAGRSSCSWSPPMLALHRRPDRARHWCMQFGEKIRDVRTPGLHVKKPFGRTW